MDSERRRGASASTGKSWIPGSHQNLAHVRQFELTCEDNVICQEQKELFVGGEALGNIHKSVLAGILEVSLET